MSGAWAHWPTAIDSKLISENQIETHKT